MRLEPGAKEDVRGPHFSIDAFLKAPALRLASARRSMRSGTTNAVTPRTRAASRAMVDRDTIASQAPFSDGKNCHATMRHVLRISRRISRPSRLAMRARACTPARYRRPRRDDRGAGRAPARRHLRTARAAPRVRRAHGLEQRLPVMCSLAALAHRHRPRRRTREGACGQGAAGPPAHQRCDAAGTDLLREGARADPRGHCRHRGVAPGSRARRQLLARRTRGAGVAPCGPRAGSAGDGGEAPAAPALHLGGRRRHGRDSRTAHPRGRRRGAARDRSRGRPVVS